MATGNLKASKWCVLINAKKETPSTDIKAELEAVLTEITNIITCKNYFAIIHDKDKDEQGKPKRTHLHLILEYPQKHTKTAVLEALIDKVGLNTEQVGVSPANSDCLLEQYLIHKNDKDKASYDAKQIITNNRHELDKRLTMEYLTPEEKEQRNIEALKNVVSLEELINITGIEFANKYRGLFKDYRAEKGQDFEGLNSKINYLIYELNRGAKILADILPLLVIDNDKQAQVLRERIETYLEDLKGRI